MRKIKPTESELEILQVLWSEGPSSVREVNERLNEVSEKDVGYTTTLKLMQIMSDKGLVHRDTSARSHIYEAAISESEIQSKLLDDFLQNAFRGSAKKLVLQALGNHATSREELEEIKKMIEKLEKDEEQ